MSALAAILLVLLIIPVNAEEKPSLNVTILPSESCSMMQPENPVCVLRAEVTASDGSSPNVNFLWTDHGSCRGQGRFNSTTSQAVEWTMPTYCPCFMLTVTASAPNYVSGNDTFHLLDMEKPEPPEGCPWNPIPEFPSTPLALLATIAVSILLLDRKNREIRAGRSRCIVKRMTIASKSAAMISTDRPTSVYSNERRIVRLLVLARRIVSAIIRSSFEARWLRTPS